MYKCARCNALSESWLCPACKRNDQLLESQRDESESQRNIDRQQAEAQQSLDRQQMEEQREIAQQQMEEQRNIAQQQMDEQRDIARQQVAMEKEIAQESNLNAFKLRLLDIAIQATTEPEKASAAALIMMRSTTFSENIHWFWEDVFRSEFLHDIYFKEALAPLREDGDAMDYLDSFDPQVMADAEGWLQWPENASDWNQGALLKIKHYKQVAQRREAERQRVEAERQRVVEEQQRIVAEQQATEAESNRRSNLRKNYGVWLLSSMVALIYGAIYLVIGWRAYHMWLADGSGLGPGSGMIAVGATGVLFLVILLATLGKIHEWAADSIQRGSQADHFTGIVWLAIAASAGIALNYWSVASDTRIHVAMLASVVILPMIPLIRELLALVIVSIVAGMLAYFTASLGGSATGSLVAWVSHDHPIATTAKPEAKPATADEAQAPHAKTPGRPAMIDDKDGWSNIRHAPSPNSTIIRRIQRTEVFYVNGTNDSWCHVVTDAGEEGWMHRSVIKFNE